MLINEKIKRKNGIVHDLEKENKRRGIDPEAERDGEVGLEAKRDLVDVVEAERDDAAGKDTSVNLDRSLKIEVKVKFPT